MKPCAVHPSIWLQDGEECPRCLEAMTPAPTADVQVAGLPPLRQPIADLRIADGQMEKAIDELKDAGLVEEEEEGCPVDDPSCTSRADENHDACTPPPPGVTWDASPVLELEQYRGHPVVLWGHDPARVIGRAEVEELPGGGYRVTVPELSPSAGFTLEQLRQHLDNNEWSLGWGGQAIEVKDGTISRLRLLEISVDPIPPDGPRTWDAGSEEMRMLSKLRGFMPVLPRPIGEQGGDRGNSPTFRDFGMGPPAPRPGPDEGKVVAINHVYVARPVLDDIAAEHLSLQSPFIVPRAARVSADRRARIIAILTVDAGHISVHALADKILQVLE